jgi:uncharacterized DUF497 family protein
VASQGGRGFDWDAANIRHATRHGYAVEEIEAALDDPYGVDFPTEGIADEERYGWIGITRNGVHIVVIFTFSGDLVRPISARRATRTERLLYTEQP